MNAVKKLSALSSVVSPFLPKFKNIEVVDHDLMIGLQKDMQVPH